MRMQVQHQLAQSLVPVLLQQTHCEDDFRPRLGASYTVDLVWNVDRWSPQITLYSSFHEPKVMLFDGGFTIEEVNHYRSITPVVNFCRGEPGCPEASIFVFYGNHRFEYETTDFQLRYWFRERPNSFWAPISPSPNEGYFTPGYDRTSS